MYGPRGTGWPREKAVGLELQAASQSDRVAQLQAPSTELAMRGILARISVFLGLCPAQNEATGNHVVEGLLFPREPTQDLSDRQGDEIGDKFREVPAGGTPEGNAIAG
jgi:hypothetical protein